MSLRGAFYFRAFLFALVFCVASWLPARAAQGSQPAPPASAGSQSQPPASAATCPVPVESPEPATSASQPTPAGGDTSQGDTALIVAGIKRTRELIEEQVKEIKEDCPPSSPQYERARHLYTTAQADYDAWATAVEMSIREGKPKNVTGLTYQQLSQEATNAGTEFTLYANDITEPAQKEGLTLSSLILSALKGIAQEGFGIAIKAPNAGTPDSSYADTFQKYAEWRPWEEITAEPPPPPPTPSPPPAKVVSHGP